MQNTKLEKWAQQLLDIGKRNSLINFRDRKSFTVEFVCPDPDVLFDKLSGDTRLEVFNPDLKEDDFDDFLLPDEEGEKTLNREEYIERYSGKLKKSQILPYCASFPPIKAVKNIGKKAKSAIEETGVNIAYVAFGFVHWKEQEGNAVYKAPLLLIPVTIENQSSVTPYYISSADDEVTLNPTFAYMLSSEYNVQLPEYDGEELYDYLQAVGEVVKKLGWSVSAEAKLGIFSFLKINMYRDLEDNAVKILQNKNVAAMLMGDGSSVSCEQSSAPVMPEALHNVVDADSSQLRAIELAKSGKSFVLQGPPGTGKSQTITNIIAECLMDGKKVLFVSEKLAALQVVYDKLKKADLAEFCLQLHSYKANKKDVIADLEHTLKLAKSGVSSKAEAELAVLEKARKQLDGYASELHTVRDKVNLSLYGLYEKYAALRKYPDADFVIESINEKGEDYLSEAADCLASYAQFIPSVGGDYTLNPWYGYINRDTSYAADLNTRSQFAEFIKFIDELSAVIRRLGELCGIDCVSAAELKNLCPLLTLIGNSDFISGELLNAEKAPAILEAVNKMKFLSADILAVQRFVEKTFDKEVYALDSTLAYKKLTRQFGGAFKRMFNKEYKSLVNDYRLCKKDGKKLSYKEMCSCAEKLSSLQEKKDEYAKLEEGVKDCLGTAYNGLRTDWGHIIRQGTELSARLKQVKSVGGLPSLTATEIQPLRSEFLQLAANAEGISEAYKSTVAAVADSFDNKVLNVREADLQSLRIKISDCLAEFDKRTNWILFLKLADKMAVNGVKKFVDYCIEKNIDEEFIVQIYKKCYYKQWIDHIIHGSEILATFNRVSQDAAVNVFTEKDKLQFSINRAVIKASLSARRPDLNFVAGGSAISVLLREAQKKRKQKPIRTLLSEIGDLAQVLKPCFMMSPLSVSTFLDPEKIQFDTVVFDEASQIFPQDAVGAIYRGKQLIVVGDSKQMPPSNFFNAMTGSDDYDDEDEDVTDFESILDMCSTTMPQLRLKWHYRSRFEELISFSNRNFYDGDLVTFPSAITKREGYGVDYRFAGGVFDRKTKTNREEAEYIADLVFKNFETYPQRSLGVVAFSAAQQDLIERCISRRRREDSSKEEFFGADREEPFFVKNLETVQGDERDTIIFSMAYARDSQGRFLANFGPVNRAGGERRLNVAVTRAKYNVQFVASVHGFDIDLKGSQSEGARLLKEYLDFAENGAAALDKELVVNDFAEFDSDFEMDVYDFLTRNGFAVDTQVGCSKFKIDLALKRPLSSEYLLAIECDGATYHSSPTARDRDRLRQQILENMGWKFYRIWSTDWFRNNRVEKERLLAAVKKAAASSSDAPLSDKEEQQESEPQDFSVDKPAVNLAFPKYKVVSVRAARTKAGRGYRNIVKEILKTEAPLSEEWLIRRSLFIFGREKITTAVYDAYENEMRFCRADGIIRRNGFLYLDGQTAFVLRVPSSDPESFREVKYISPEELACGLYEIVKHNVTVSREGAFRELASQLGYTRLTDSVEEAFTRALKLLSLRVEADGDMLSVKKRG